MHQPEVDNLLLRLITRVALFKSLEREDILGLLQYVNKATFAKGDIVFEEGDQGKSMYVVVQGCFEVYRELKGQIEHIAKISPGEHFGEIALLSNRTRTASVRCVDAGVALSFSKQAIYSQPNVAALFFRNMSVLVAERLVSTNEEIILYKSEQFANKITDVPDLPDKLRSSTKSIYGGKTPEA
jgi:CRP-like cAMP-binding protein